VLGIKDEIVKEWQFLRRKEGKSETVRYGAIRSHMIQVLEEFRMLGRQVLVHEFRSLEQFAAVFASVFVGFLFLD
jgi:uncharacterized protein with von Willebrand factor type A (vWA) domain